MDFFTQAIARDAKAKKQRAKHQLANDLSRHLAESISVVEQTTENRLESEKRRIIHSVNRQLSEAQFSEKIKYTNMRDRQIAWLFDTAKTELENFTRSPEYESYLVERINQVKQDYDFAIVSLNSSDMHLAEKIMQATSLIVEEGCSDYIGGFILLTKNRKARIDYTFKTRLKEYGQTNHDAPWRR